MTFFTKQEYETKYQTTLANTDLYKIDVASDMIYNQVGLRYRDPNWNKDTVTPAVKNASMEQLRFMLEYDIPCLDNRGAITAGAMTSDLISDISTYALRMLGNGDTTHPNGYLHRGNPINYGMSMNIPFGE
jgi:hypothetical protein